MSPQRSTTAPSTEVDADRAAPATDRDPAMVEEVLVEEISIDGMCGVY